ncbi:MAG: hypothetical protein E6J99_09965 [Methanobacteriota archaeon]|nr:MAG: hypothetical protein E6J99_09965 [Euryarchaeota archaeon]
MAAGRLVRRTGKASEGIPEWRPWSGIPEDSEIRPKAVALVELLAFIVLLVGVILARLLIR